MYNAMLMKTTSSNYLKYRTWTLTAAKNLDSSCTQFNTVKAAWDAVTVPAQSADPTCGGTTTPRPPAATCWRDRARVRRGVMSGHDRRDRHQRRSPGPHRLLEGLARRRRRASTET